MYRLKECFYPKNHSQIPCIPPDACQKKGTQKGGAAAPPYITLSPNFSVVLSCALQELPLFNSPDHSVSSDTWSRFPFLF